MSDGGERPRTVGPATVGRLGLLVILVAVLVAQVPVLIDLAISGVVYQDQGITDLGRDLLGASAVEQGGLPYQQVGDLISRYEPPELPLSGPPRPSGWVVHPPLALAGARVLLATYGPDAELVARRLGAVAVLVAAFAIIAVLARRKASWAIPAAIVTVVWVPTFTDTVWIQWNALAGLGLLAVILLDSNGRRAFALIVLGLLVAWKPWLAVFALALPGSSSSLRDVGVVAGTAVAATLAVLPFIGGFDSLWAWITEAIPGNAVEARDTPSNLSWTSFAGPGPATAIYLAAAGSIPLIRRWLPRNLWLLLPAWVATAAAPFVWDHYWLALAAVMWLVLAGTRPDLGPAAAGWAGLAVLPVALSRLGYAGLENRVLPMVFAGVSLFLGAALLVRRFQLGKQEHEP